MPKPMLVPSASPPRVSIYTPRGVASVAVEIASTPAERARGLMYRNHLDPGAGMLFVMEADRPWPFYMRNTRIPLDMIFIARDMTVAGVVPHAQPCTETLRSVASASRFVLEVNAGWAAAHGVLPGAQVRFDGFVGR